MRPAIYVDPLLRCFGLALLCLVVACGSDEDRPADEGGKKPPAKSVAAGESTDRHQNEPVSIQIDPPPDEARAARPASAIDYESFNARDVLAQLQALSWDEDDNLDPQASDLLRRLRLLGADAVVPLRDFLLDSETSSPQLRQALLEVLLGLGSPEVEGAALELLAGQPSAFEAWQLGYYLESVQPGRYSAAIRSAAEQALIETGSAEILPGEFFTFLAQLGNEETALLLSELPAHQEAYGSVALVYIPEGGGLPMLEQEARLFEGGRDTLQGRLALQLLAQQAPQHPRAAAALIELAEQGLIPHGLWPYVLDIVAGSWEISLSRPATGDLIGSHTYYHADGNQVIYRVARHEDDADDGIHEQRLYLLDRLQTLAPSDP